MTRGTKVAIDPHSSAKAARLRYVADSEPGITRKRSGRSFRYYGVRGKPVRDARTLSRIRSLVIPPAWSKVWVCPSPHGHIQATGRDARGRKQYLYHSRWSETRDETKYERMIVFGRALPQIRRQVKKDLGRPLLSRDKVLAAVIRLLELTGIRVGNREYERLYGSFGLTTLRDRHVNVSGPKVLFQFRGKSGKDHCVEINDGRLSRIVKQCQDIPGHELFQFIDDSGKRQKVDSTDVNLYLRQITDEDFTAKDFRTWFGTILTCSALRKLGAARSKTHAKQTVAEAIKEVAKQLGNTAAVCRRSYIHPAIIDSYSKGTLLASLDQLGEKRRSIPRGFWPEEALVLAFLRQCGNSR